MFLPISDAPNPKGRPYATIALIALNVLAFVLINLPLATQPPNPEDPAFTEYVEFLSQLVTSRQQLEQAVRQVSAYDLFVFEHGFRPAQPSLFDLLFSMFTGTPGAAVYCPAFAVTWEEIGTDVAALVSRAQREHLQVKLCNFAAQPKAAAMRVWRTWSS